MKPTDRVQLKIYLSRAQRDGLAKVAAERGESQGALIRDHIRALTGEPDIVFVNRPRKKPEGPRRRPGRPRGSGQLRNKT